MCVCVVVSEEGQCVCVWSLVRTVCGVCVGVTFLCVSEVRFWLWMKSWSVIQQQQTEDP